MRRFVSIVFFTLLCVAAFSQNNAADSLLALSPDSLIARYIDLEEYTITARVKEKDIIIKQPSGRCCLNLPSAPVRMRVNQEDCYELDIKETD